MSAAWETGCITPRTAWISTRRESEYLHSRWKPDRHWRSWKDAMARNAVTSPGSLRYTVSLGSVRSPSMKIGLALKSASTPKAARDWVSSSVGTRM